MTSKDYGLGDHKTLLAEMLVILILVNDTKQ